MTTHTGYGPNKIHVHSTPSGADVDFSHLLELIICDLAEGHLEDLQELALLQSEAQTALSHGNDDSHAMHKRDALAQELAERYGHAPVEGRAAVVMGERLRELGVQALPNGVHTSVRGEAA